MKKPIAMASMILVLTAFLAAQDIRPGGGEDNPAPPDGARPVLPADAGGTATSPPAQEPPSSPGASPAVNEDEMFASPETVIDRSALERGDVDADQDRKRLGISGELTSVNQYYMTRNTFSRFSHQGNLFNPYIDGVLFLDARLPAGIKGFGNFEAIYNARLNETTWAARELFIDFNIARTVYFRTGKQVLQWGRCYLWNPTDLINVEKKTFLEKIGSREGAYGIKGQVSFGTAVNMYVFADTAGAEDLNRIGGAYKLEFLVRNTEMAVSIWGRKGNNPVMGYDFSTRILGIDVTGEACASTGSNTSRVSVTGGTLETTRDGSWTGKMCIDFGRSFTFNNQPDKIQVNMEFFFNGEGYGENIFSDNATYAHSTDLVVTNPDGTESTIPAAVPVTRTVYMLANDLFQPNYHGRYYTALFTTVNRFITSDFSLRNNLISNIEQGSFVLSSGIDYAGINDLRAGLTINGFLGKRYTEYTFLNNAMEILVRVGIVF